MRRSTTWIIAVALCMTGSAYSSTISFDPGSFAVLAGGTFGSDSHVTIYGKVGAVGNTSIGMHSSIDGSLYTTGEFYLGHKAGVSGNVLSSGNAYLDMQSYVGSLQSGATVGLGQQATVAGNLVSNGAMNINKQAVIHGDVSYGTTYWADRHATVHGNVSANGVQTDVWSPTLNSGPGEWYSNNTHVYSPADSLLTLDPGTYGSISFDRNSVIYLTAGTYNLDSLWLGQSARIVADTRMGAVVVNIRGDLSTGNNAAITGHNPGLLAFNTQGSISLGQNNEASAVFNAYGSSLTVGQNSLISGQLHSSGNLWLGKQVSVQGVASPSHVPEPASIFLVVTGLVGICLYKTGPFRGKKLF